MLSSTHCWLYQFNILTPTILDSTHKLNFLRCNNFITVWLIHHHDAAKGRPTIMELLILYSFQCGRILILMTVERTSWEGQILLVNICHSSVKFYAFVNDGTDRNQTAISAGQRTDTKPSHTAIVPKHPPIALVLKVEFSWKIYSEEQEGSPR